MTAVRAIAATTVLLVFIGGGPASADQPASQTAQETSAPAAVETESKLAGAVALTGLSGLIISGLRRRSRTPAG